MSNIYDNAYSLEKAIRESEEFKALTEAYQVVMENDISRKMFEKFRDIQMELQEKQMSGQDITEDEIENARKIVEDVQQYEPISKLMEEEQRLNLVINDVSQIITKPLEELYGFDDDSES